MSALSVAAGCVAPAVQPAPVAQGPQAAGAKFQAVMKDGQLVCDTCGAKLNAQGRHQRGETLVRAVRYMKDPKTFAQQPTNSKLDLREVIIASIGKIGYQRLGFKLPAEATAATGERVNQFPDACGDDQCWRDYVKANPYGCCVPDSVPIPDPPY